MSAQISSLQIFFRRLLIVTWLAVSLLTPAWGTELPPLQMGVLPYLSTGRLFEKFLPLKDYLEAQLQRRIVLSTAPNFNTYVQRAAQGEYDIYFTAPHFALLAETDQGYRRLGRFTRELDGVIVVRRDSAVQRPEDLRRRTVITPPRLAIISMLGERLLQNHGLLPDKDYALQHTSSHDNAIFSVYRGTVDAALIGRALFEQSSPEVTRELRILSSTSTLPHLMAMAHPRLTPAEYRHLKRALLAFTRNGPGQKFFEASGLGDMGTITDADMNRLRPFLSMTRERLQ